MHLKSKKCEYKQEANNVWIYSHQNYTYFYGADFRADLLSLVWFLLFNGLSTFVDYLTPIRSI